METRNNKRALALVAAAAVVIGVLIWRPSEARQQDRHKAPPHVLTVREKALRDDYSRKLTEADAYLIGQTVLSYAQDDAHDYRFPARNADVRAVVGHYLKVKGKELARRFAPRRGTREPNNPKNPVFVYMGVKGNPQYFDVAPKTALGYKRGPGGRAVFYADGHTEWKAD